MSILLLKCINAGNKTTTNYRDLLASKHSVNYFDFCDIDKLSMIELEHMCDKLNIFGPYSFYVQELQNGQPSNISLIQSGRENFNLLRFVNGEGEVDVYIELLKPI